MPGITYTIRFHRRDHRGCLPEEQEYLPDRASEQSWSSAVLEAHSAQAK